MLKGHGAPNTGVVGNVGDYFEDLDTGKIYKLATIVLKEKQMGFVTIPEYVCETNQYVWVPVVGEGGGLDLEELAKNPLSGKYVEGMGYKIVYPTLYEGDYTPQDTISVPNFNEIMGEYDEDIILAIDLMEQTFLTDIRIMVPGENKIFTGDMFAIMCSTTDNGFTAVLNTIPGTYPLKLYGVKTAKIDKDFLPATKSLLMMEATTGVLKFSDFRDKYEPLLYTGDADLVIRYRVGSVWYDVNSWYHIPSKSASNQYIVFSANRRDTGANMLLKLAFKNDVLYSVENDFGHLLIGAGDVPYRIYMNNGVLTAVEITDTETF